MFETKLLFAVSAHPLDFSISYFLLGKLKEMELLISRSRGEVDLEYAGGLNWHFKLSASAKLH